MRPLVAFLALALPACGQRLLEFGPMIGVPISEAFNTSSYSFLATGYAQGISATRRYTIGAEAAVRLPRRFGVEIDVLYKRLGFDVNTSPPPFRGIAFYHTWTTANSWEFPLLASYRITRRFFASGGVSFRGTTGISATTDYWDLLGSPITRSHSATDPHLNGSSNQRSHAGAVAAVGARFHLLSPEVRYTRWREDSGDPGSVIRSNPNQVDFLLGIIF